MSIQNVDDWKRSVDMGDLVALYLEALGFKKMKESLRKSQVQIFLPTEVMTCRYELCKHFNARRNGEYRNVQYPKRKGKSAFYMSLNPANLYEFYLFSPRDYKSDTVHYLDGTRWDTTSGKRPDDRYGDFNDFPIEDTTFFRFDPDAKMFFVKPVHYSKRIYSKGIEKFLDWWYPLANTLPLFPMSDEERVIFDPNATIEELYG